MDDIVDDPYESSIHTEIILSSIDNVNATNKNTPVEVQANESTDDFTEIERYEFALDRGYFYLRESTREFHKVNTKTIFISVENECFGNPLISNIMFHFIGYETILLNLIGKIFQGHGAYFLYIHIKERNSCNFHLTCH